jgi:hypothetical protein
MLENILMPREYGYKARSYEVDILDDDIMDALPKAQQDQYIEKQIKPQIEEQLKGIEFDNEEDKSKVYTQAVSNIKAKEWGTKHAWNLKTFDTRYKDNEYYKQNYISKLQEIINQDSIKTRSGTKTITKKNKDDARELLKAIGIKPELKVVAPVYVPPTAEAPPATPPREKQARVTRSEAEAERKAEEIGKKAAEEKAKKAAEEIAKKAAEEKAKKAAEAEEKAKKAAEAEEKAKKEAEEYLRSEPVTIAAKKPPPAVAETKPPPAAAAAAGPPPPPPPPPLTVVSDKELEAKKALAAASAKMMQELVDRAENDDPDERAKKKEATSKTQGTKDGKNLLEIKKQWITYTGYRDNYEKNLKAVLDDDKTTPEKRTIAEDLLKKLDEQYKFDASKDMPDPTTTTNLKIVEPRYKSSEAYKKEYKKRGNKLLKKIRENSVPDKEDKKNIKLIEDYFKLFD